MDALSSSFLSTSSLWNLSLTLPPSNLNPLLDDNLSSVIIGKKTPSTATPTAAARATSQSSRNQNRSSVHIQKPPATRTFPAIIFNALDDVIDNFVDPPIRPCVDPRNVLSDNFAPVDELPPTECEVVEGFLPPCLDGAYFRNGPNSQFLPRGPHHLFDGDGMLHAIRISRGRATLCSRFVKTYRYTIERETGSPVIPKFFSAFSSLTASAARGAVTLARVLSGQFDPTRGVGLANTSLAFFGRKLYDLGESDLPYAVKLSPDGDILTLGRDDFDGKLFTNMTAHPKVDPDTGEVFAFRYGPIPPFLTFFRFDADGAKQADVPIFSMTRPSFIHDFAITGKYAIFPDIQIGMNPAKMVFRGGSPMCADPEKVPRLGIIPRYSVDESEMRWFDVPGFNILHVVNAWEEDGGDAVVLVAPNVLSVEHTMERADLIHGLVEKVRIDLKTGVVSRHPVAARPLDLPVINRNYVGKKNRYAYAAIGDSMLPMLKIIGVAKLEISAPEDGRRDCTVASWMFRPGCYSGEPFFIGRCWAK